MKTKTQCLLGEGSIPGTALAHHCRTHMTWKTQGRLGNEDGQRNGTMDVVDLKVLLYLLSRRPGSCWQGIHKGPLTMGEEGVPGIPTGFMNF